MRYVFELRLMQILHYNLKFVYHKTHQKLPLGAIQTTKKIVFAFNQQQQTLTLQEKHDIIFNKTPK